MREITSAVGPLEPLGEKGEERGTKGKEVQQELDVEDGQRNRHD